ncbi:MAG: 4a-hydroxytetrahydrobiopterin dehydratase [Chloroflexota bacterium]
MEKLAAMRCVACRGDEPALTEAQIAELLPQVAQWDVVEKNGIKRLERAFEFRNFSQAMAFTNQISDLAESEDHHPMIVTEWGEVKVNWWTHKIGGLHRNDFIMAAKTDDLYANLPKD